MNNNSYKIWLIQMYANEAGKLIKDVNEEITHETATILDQLEKDFEHGIVPNLQRYELPVS